MADWARIDAMTDADIEAAMRDDPDWKDHLNTDWSKAEVVFSLGLNKQRLDRMDESEMANLVVGKDGTDKARLQATSESSARITIKPIVWETDGISIWENANSPRYDIARRHRTGTFGLSFADHIIRHSEDQSDFPNEVEAMAAAQAHKEKRILSEIEAAIESTETFTLAISRDSLREKIAADPDLDVEVRNSTPHRDLAAENARLRAALERIAEADPRSTNSWSAHEAFAWAAAVANTALKGGDA